MVLLDFISLFVCSYLWVVLLNIIPSVYERLALSLVLMFGVKSLVVYGLIVMGLKPEIALQSVASLGILVVGGGLTWFKREHIRKTGETPVMETDKRSGAMIVFTIGVLFALSLSNALFFPITEGDGVWHEIRGVRLFHEHQFDLAGYHYNSYAPFMHLLYAYLLSINIESFKIISPLFYLCLLIIFYHRLRAYHKNQNLAAIATLMLGATPYFWWHSVLPFLNLATGFYFATAAIYWFFLINELIQYPRGDQHSRMVSLALLSGLFFGLAAWVRLEFFLYDVIPFAMLIYVLEQKTELSQNDKNRVILGFACPMLSFTSLWLMTALTFKVSHGKNVYGVAVVCALVAVCTILYVVGGLRIKARITPKNLGWAAAMIGVLFVLVLATKGAKSVSLGQAIILGLYRTVFFNVFYSFTVFLAGLLFFGRLKQLASAEKYLGGFLLAYLFVHFAIYTFSEPKWGALSAYVDATFVHFGNAVNSSGTREMLAFYPILVYLVLCLPRVKESYAGGNAHIRNFMSMMVALNLLVLLVVFIVPRSRFMISNRHLTAAQIMETSGTPDMPNSARETYVLLNRIREATDATATVFLPPLEGGHRSHPLQRLYPRKLYWGDLPEYQENMANPPWNSYFVVRQEWHPEYCSNKPKIKLSDKGDWMCRMDDGK